MGYKPTFYERKQVSIITFDLNIMGKNFCQVIYQDSAGEISQVKCLPGKHEDLCSIPRTHVKKLSEDDG